MCWNVISFVFPVIIMIIDLQMIIKYKKNINAEVGESKSKIVL